MTRLLTTTAISGGVLLSLLSTAGAQTPLPPIEVNAPKAFELGQIKVGARRLGVPTRAAQPGDGAGESRSAQAVPSEKIDNGPTPSQHTDAFGGYTITNRQMETFARPTLDTDLRQFTQ
ncbi:MAG: TonB-dependent receptor [Methylocystaceae bacterium]|nr:MAG: TonB-dependent receptor [Methylocystaceae bacterium]